MAFTLPHVGDKVVCGTLTLTKTPGVSISAQSRSDTPQPGLDRTANRARHFEPNCLAQCSPSQMRDLPGHPVGFFPSRSRDTEQATPQ